MENYGFENNLLDKLRDTPVTMSAIITKIRLEEAGISTRLSLIDKPLHQAAPTDYVEGWQERKADLRASLERKSRLITLTEGCCRAIEQSEQVFRHNGDFSVLLEKLNALDLDQADKKFISKLVWSSFRDAKTEVFIDGLAEDEYASQAEIQNRLDEETRAQSDSDPLVTRIPDEAILRFKKMYDAQMERNGAENRDSKRLQTGVGIGISERARSALMELLG